MSSVGDHGNVWAFLDDQQACMVRYLLAEKDSVILQLREVIESLSDHNVAAERMALIKEQGAEIERLKELVESWKGGHSIAALDRDLAKDQIKRLEEALQRQDNEIIDLKALITRMMSPFLYR